MSTSLSLEPSRLDKLLFILDSMHLQAKEQGGAAREMFDGYGPVWVEAKRSAGTGRVCWTIEERRVRRSEIPSFLGLTGNVA